MDAVEARRWLDAARQTLESARGDLERGDYNWSCFKSQQAAELALKALAIAIGQPRFTHGIYALLRVLKSASVNIGDGRVEDCARMLDKYYIPTRYPDAWPAGSPSEYYTLNEARRALVCAELIVETVEKVLGV